MKYKYLIILITIAATVLGSCIRQPIADNRLVRIDSLLRSYPDSALYLLESMNPTSLSHKENQVYYTLLLAQVRDKKMIRSFSDSLIRVAVHYYDSIGNIPMQAKAHYLWARYFHDQKDETNAIQEYLLALELAQKANNKKLLLVLYNKIGHIYYKQNLNEQADSIYLQAEHLSLLLQDSALLAEALAYRGMIQLSKGKIYYPIVEKRLVQAYNIISSLKGQQLLKYDIISYLSTVYGSMENDTKSLRFAKEFLALQNDTTICYDAFFLLGNAYYQSNQNDSAIAYLSKGILSNNFEIKSRIYALLADIAQERRSYKKAMEFEKLHTMYVDRLKRIQQNNRFISLERQAEQKFKQTKFYNSIQYYRTFLISLSVAFPFIIFCLYIIFKRYNSHLKQKFFALKQKNEHLQEELDNNLMKIYSLQVAIKKMYSNKKKKVRLENDLEQLNQKRTAYLEENYKFSEVYTKIERIIASYRNTDRSEESFSESDWKQLVYETDKRWINFTIRLKTDYTLSQEEVNLCCLFLTRLPIDHIKYILGCSRDNVYKKIYSILDIMKLEHKRENLEKVLRKYTENAL